MSMSTDPMYDPMDRYNDDFYCEHGTFIGNPYGADYMCFDCEMGTPWDEYVRGNIIQGNYARRKYTTDKFLTEVFKQMPHPWPDQSWKDLVIAIVVNMNRHR